MSGEVVLARGDRDAQLAAASPISLGRPPGAGSAASGQSDVVALQETFGLQSVEVELGLMPGDAYCFGGLVSADRFSLRAHEPVQQPANRIGQGTDAGHVPIDHPASRSPNGQRS